MRTAGKRTTSTFEVRGLNEAVKVRERLSVMQTNDQLQPTVFVIFGGAGDLTWRKLVPALFDLSQDQSMPADFAIIAWIALA